MESDKTSNAWARRAMVNQDSGVLPRRCPQAARERVRVVHRRLRVVAARTSWVSYTRRSEVVGVGGSRPRRKPTPGFEPQSRRRAVVPGSQLSAWEKPRGV